MPKPDQGSTSAQRIYRVSDLPERRGIFFKLATTAEERGEIAGRLRLTGLRKLSFEGELRPKGRRDWLLTGQLGATVVQDCVVTLDPVVTRIDDPVTRRYSADFNDLAGQAEAPQSQSGKSRAKDAEETADPRDMAQDMARNDGGAMINEDETLDPLPQVIDLSEIMEEALALSLPLYPRADGAALSDANFTEPGQKAMTDEDVKPFAGLAGLRDQLAGKTAPSQGADDSDTSENDD
jgi:uncharacterized metal-binding protein YceD (DUF177 family)